MRHRPPTAGPGFLSFLSLLDAQATGDAAEVVVFVDEEPSAPS